MGMARTYRPLDRDQEFLLPPNVIAWLEQDHLVCFVIEAVKRLDTRVFHRLAKPGGVGQRGYDLDIMHLLQLARYRRISAHSDPDLATQHCPVRRSV